jgi:signal transduction histidine kinase
MAAPAAPAYGSIGMVPAPPPRSENSAVESSAAGAAAAMAAAAESLQARLELVLDERLGALTADQRGFLEVAKSDGQRLLRLIGDFREIALADAGLLDLDWSAADLEQAAGEAEADVAARAQLVGKDVVVRCEQPSTIRADAARVREVLRRLTRQAVQHGAPGCTIALDVGRVGVTIRYEADAPPTADSIAVALATAIARAHGGALDVRWADPAVELEVSFAASEATVVRLGVAA